MESFTGNIKIKIDINSQEFDLPEIILHQIPDSRYDNAINTIVEITHEWSHSDPNFIRLLTYFQSSSDDD